MLAVSHHKPFGVFFAILSGLLLSSLCSYHHRTEAQKPRFDSRLFFCSRKAEEKVAFAKMLLRLPPSAPPGLLWHTYMSRVYNVPVNATIEQMEGGQVNKDTRLNNLSEGLPDWCPDAVRTAKSGFEINVMLKFTGRRVYSIAPLASEEEDRRISADKYREYENAARCSKSPLSFEDWYARQIVHGFGLPKETSNSEAWATYNRSFRLTPAPCTKQDHDEIYAAVEREENQRLFSDLGELSISDVKMARNTVLEGIRIESPDKPTKFKIWY